MATVRTRHIATTVLIIGGGLSGLTLAAVLGEAGVDVTCIDHAPPFNQLQQQYDGRTTAISYSSHQVLQMAGVWEKMRLDCEPILDIRVADGNSPFYLHFASETDGNGAPFGWIIENRLMRRALFENTIRLKKKVRHIAPAEIKKFISDISFAGILLKDGTKITAPLLVGADGRHSATREWLGIPVQKTDYHQAAIVCNVAHTLDHENVAVEHFRAAGPFAILPMTRSKTGEHRSSVVWTEHGIDAGTALKLSPEEFDRRLQELFGSHLGDVRHVSPPMKYPLHLMHAESYIGPRVALMAEAAHAIHPIAGQGLNLSMRDIAVLAELIIDHLKLGLDVGSPTLLKNYEKKRRSDTAVMAAVTNALNRLFSNDLKTVGLVRGFGLGMVEQFPLLKRYFAAQAMGISGVYPYIGRNRR
ncbi:MAG: UbiH/UbiF/VisC/COQ6 family ubiquinone biosynthesis hydroxylase [Proteobacteria bacterium]|nr:UbiH/UbiF/VisC/COQ6 family ubiquinone biosynthesis hydroxylase [Pseudomonadota bacterium]